MKRLLLLLIVLLFSTVPVLACVGSYPTLLSQVLEGADMVVKLAL